MTFLNELILPYLRSETRKRATCNSLITTAMLCLDYDSSAGRKFAAYCEKGIRNGKWNFDESLLRDLVASNIESQFLLLKVSSLWDNFPPSVFRAIFPALLKRFRNNEAKLPILADSLCRFLACNPDQGTLAVYRNAIRTLLRSRIRTARILGAESFGLLGVPTKSDLAIIFGGISDIDPSIRNSSLNAFSYILAALPANMVKYLQAVGFERKLVNMVKSDESVGGTAQLVLKSYRKVVLRAKGNLPRT